MLILMNVESELIDLNFDYYLYISTGLDGRSEWWGEAANRRKFIHNV